MEYRVYLNLFSTAAVIAIGIRLSLLTSTVVAARAVHASSARATARPQTMMVKGSASRRIKSDLGLWRIQVQGEGKELKSAFEELDAGVSRVRRFLEQKGYPPAEIGLSSIATETIYQRVKSGDKITATNAVERYRLVRTFDITSGDVQRVEQTAGEVTQLIQEGVFVTSLPPEYYYSQVADLKVAMMGDAARDARARADEIARNAGCKVGEVRDAHMGVLQITRPYSTEVSDCGLYDTSTIDKDVQAVVTVTFGIQSGT